MEPALGDPVIVVGPHSNGATEHPGLISRVWESFLVSGVSTRSVNVHVFRDGNPSLPMTSVPFFASLEEANTRSQGRIPFCYPKPSKV